MQSYPAQYNEIIYNFRDMGCNQDITITACFMPSSNQPNFN